MLPTILIRISFASIHHQRTNHTTQALLLKLTLRLSLLSPTPDGLLAQKEVEPAPKNDFTTSPMWNANTYDVAKEQNKYMQQQPLPSKNDENLRRLRNDAAGYNTMNFNSMDAGPRH